MDQELPQASEYSRKAKARAGMKTNCQTGEAVRVFDTPGNSSRAEAGETGIPSRPGTVTGMLTPMNGWTDKDGNPLPPDSMPSYWVAFSDGAEPAVQAVRADYLSTDTALALGLATQAGAKADAAQVASDEAARLASEAKQLADAAKSTTATN